MRSNLTLKKLFSKPKTEYIRLLYKKFPGFSEIFRDHSPVVILGAARMGKIFLSNLRKKRIPVIAFIDNDRLVQGSSLDGVPVLSVKQAKQQYQDYPVFVASLLYESVLFDDMRKHGFRKIYPLCLTNIFYPSVFASPEYEGTFDVLFSDKNQRDILKVFNMLGDEKSKNIFTNLIAFRLLRDKKFIHTITSQANPFLNRDLLPLSTNEVFLDAGAFDGDSVKLFHKATKGRFTKIYSFEPDGENVARLKERIRQLKIKDRVEVVKKGIYNRSGFINFDEMGTVDSRITKNSFGAGEKSHVHRILVVSLDEYFVNREVPTTIKMDIEGVEDEALTGTQKIIKKYKPKLAISIYHHATDLWKLPLYIKKLNPKYHLFLRHYSQEIVDTICYAS